MFKNSLFSSMVLVAGLAFASAVHAVTIYTDQTAFLAAIDPDYYLEDFDALAFEFIASPLNFTDSTYSYTAAATNGFFNEGTGTDVWLGTSALFDILTFTFTSGNITAVGGYFFTTNFAGGAIPGNITVSINPSGTLTATTPTTFLGFTSPTPFSTLTLQAVQNTGGSANVWPMANDLIVGGVAAVPEPTSLALLGLGLAGLGFRAPSPDLIAGIPEAARNGGP